MLGLKYSHTLLWMQLLISHAGIKVLPHVIVDAIIN